MECVNSVKFFDEIPNRVHSNESWAESFSRLFVSPSNFNFDLGFFVKLN